MDVSREACFLFAEHGYPVIGNIRNTEGLKADRTLGQSHKGHSQESQDNKCKHFVHHIFFLLLIMTEPLQGPFYGIAHLNTAECSATVVPAEKLEPWADIPEQFQNQTQSAQREGTRTEGSNRYRGGVKKDTCGGSLNWGWSRKRGLAALSAPTSAQLAKLQAR